MASTSRYIDKSVNGIKNLAVVIVNWERPVDTIECLVSIIDAGIPQNQVIVVDNGSKDNSEEVIRKKFPCIHFVKIEENRGFACGYNIGIQYALTLDIESVLLLNNDTVVEPQAIQHLVAAGDDIAVPKILFFDDPSMIWAAGARFRFFPPAIVMIGYKRKDSTRFDFVRPIDYATGCAFLAKRGVFEKLGGFDEKFINYMEDYDFFHRAKVQGFKTRYIPTARVYHKVSKTLGESSAKKWFFLGRNTVYFYRKEGRFPLWVLLSTTVWVAIRELAKGNYRSLSHFLEGYKEGCRLVKDLR